MWGTPQLHVWRNLQTWRFCSYVIGGVGWKALQLILYISTQHITKLSALPEEIYQFLLSKIHVVSFCRMISMITGCAPKQGNLGNKLGYCAWQITSGSGLQSSVWLEFLCYYVTEAVC
jgi:hypothetical protein